MPESDFVRFLKSSPTAYHAAREIRERLSFADLHEKDRWKLEPGKSYCVTRGDSLVVAFRLPKKTAEKGVLLASHLDSPALKLKPHPESSSHDIGLLGTENYGAPLLHTWLDRDLKIAGRVTLKNGTTQLVSLDKYPISIPSLAIHLNRDVTEKGLIVHKQDHLKIPFTLKFHEHALEKQIGLGPLLGTDLFLVSAEEPALLGFEQDLLAAYRLDNLSSAYACLEAMKNSKVSEHTLQMAIFWDHEEIGSTSYVGAGSLFIDQLLERIIGNREDLFRLKSQSLCLSVDVGHGFHPNFSDKYDPANSPEMGKGVMVKFNANQKYATDSLHAAHLIQLAESKKIPIQKQANRSDIPTGSTVGSIMAANVGIPTLDIGIPCWAMHSIRETVALKDMEALTALLEASL